MTYEYIPRGVCSRRLVIEASEQGIIDDIAIEGGCEGNLKGLAALLRGRSANEIAGLLEGIRCGGKETSCPDQIAKALRKIAARQEEGKS